MKFENIKVNDTVFVETTVTYGWNLLKCFFIPKKVERITKKQFIIKGDRKFRKDGREIGKSSNAYFINDNIIGFGRGLIKDQTLEMINFKEKLNLEKNIIKSISELKLDINSELSIEELNNLKDKINVINNLL